MSKAKDKILIIQTAFIGDVILATVVIEALNAEYPDAKIDMLVRKGNESLLTNHPKLNKVLVWDKKHNKLLNQIKLIKSFRREKYDIVINLQRFLSSGIFTVFSGAKTTIGFDKNPLSFAFKYRLPHKIAKGIHEVDRNLSLLSPLFSLNKSQMRLYPSDSDYKKVSEFKSKPYIVIAPTSVWYTKQYPENKWVEFINKIELDINILLIGGPDDYSKIEEIISKSRNINCINLSGKLSFLESTALMKDAKMNYVNDSAPMHMASAVNAPTTAIYCSTVPEFGFGPKANKSYIVEIEDKLECRSCGLHGRKECKEGHFDCANKINVEQLIITLN
jgi:heptosyltransferase-2